ncbi:MAG: hypothetical protein V3R31_06610 [Candidatus Humimicrobiaceae bacterium]
MNKRTIIILVLCAALIAAIAIISLKKDPAITGLYLSGAPTFSQKEKTDEEPASVKDFQSKGSDIYLIIGIRDLDTNDTIEVTWTISGKDEDIVFQENTISPERSGSGEIIIYLLKRDDEYPGENYIIEVMLNGSNKMQIGFTIDAE